MSKLDDFVNRRTVVDLGAAGEDGGAQVKHWATRVAHTCTQAISHCGGVNKTYCRVAVVGDVPLARLPAGNLDVGDGVRGAGRA